MSGFVMDTSGRVGADPNWDRFGGEQGLAWPDLSPFTQGYVEAMLLGALDALGTDPDTTHANFSDLAPETLARIMEDCAALDSRTDGPRSAQQGRDFWATRQRGDASWSHRFPPLTPYLGDDGKVYLREGV